MSGKVTRLGVDSHSKGISVCGEGLLDRVESVALGGLPELWGLEGPILSLDNDIVAYNIKSPCDDVNYRFTLHLNPKGSYMYFTGRDYGSLRSCFVGNKFIDDFRGNFNKFVGDFKSFYLSRIEETNFIIKQLEEIPQCHLLLIK